jgi:hypothetical protein
MGKMCEILGYLLVGCWELFESVRRSGIVRGLGA